MMFTHFINSVLPRPYRMVLYYSSGSSEVDVRGSMAPDNNMWPLKVFFYPEAISNWESIFQCDITILIRTSNSPTQQLRPDINYSQCFFTLLK